MEDYPCDAEVYIKTEKIECTWPLGKCIHAEFGKEHAYLGTCYKRYDSKMALVYIAGLNRDYVDYPILHLTQRGG